MVGLEKLRYCYTDHLPGHHRCDLCHAYLIPSMPARSVGRLNLDYDLSLSEDGAIIASHLARGVFTRYSGSEIRYFPIAENAWRLECLEILFVDTERSGISCINECPRCGLYENQVWNAKCVFMNCEAIKSDGIYFSDMLFGWKPGLSPMLFLGAKVEREIRRHLNVLGTHNWKYGCS